MRQIELATLPHSHPNTAFLAAFRPERLSETTNCTPLMPCLTRLSKKAPQVLLGFRQGTRDTQHPEIFIGTNANGGKDGNIPNYTIKPRFLIAGIDD